MRDVGTKSPAVAPLFRSETQLAVLGVLYRERQPITISEIAERAGAPVSTVSREVARLAGAGIITVSGRGRSKFVEARRDFAWAPALAELLDRTVGIAAAISDAFADLDDVELVAIFGSWAARRLGREGPPPRDIDVLIVGRPSALGVVDAARRVSRAVGIEVEPVVVSPEQWADPHDDPVLASIKAGPLVELIDARGDDG